MKDNYRPWGVNIDDFFNESDLLARLKFLVKFAVLAPSSHNSQPWRFEIAANKIVLSSDFSRALPKSDTNHRQLYISIGCALENLLTAADYYGFKGQVEYFSDGTDRIEVNFSPGGERGRSGHPIFSISRRHTNRNRYLSRLPDGEFLKWLSGLSGEDFEVRVIGGSGEKNKIAELVTNANVTAMDDPGFRSELSGYVKSNLTGDKLGMPMFGFGMPLLPSLAAPFMVKNFNVNRMSKKDDLRLLKDFTPVFAVIGGRRDNREAWVRAGQLFERAALEAERHELQTAPMAAVVQIGEFYKELQKILKTEFRPMVFFRLGYAEKITPHSPRLSAEDVIKNDKS